MKVVRKINNNAVICIDGNGNEVVAFGKGIGFPSVPYDLKDLGKIERTFYGIDPRYLGLLKEIPSDVFDTAVKIVDYAVNHLDHEMNPNIVFTIADHINFAITRYRQGINVRPPYLGDLAYLHAKEYAVGEKAVAYINMHFHVHLIKEEASSIALHFINAEVVTAGDTSKNPDTVIYEVTKLIEKDLNVTIQKNGFNYNRFVTHLQYLMKRLENHEAVDSGNAELMPQLKENYPAVYACAEKIATYMKARYGQQLSEEEIVYLMIHINRLMSREEKH